LRATCSLPPLPPLRAEGTATPDLHRIFIVGGGAGGLELATRLGHKLGKTGKARITLIEKARSHFWKPHLHEIAAGSMDLHAHATDYLHRSAHRRAPATQPLEFVEEAVPGVELGADQRRTARRGLPRDYVDAAPCRTHRDAAGASRRSQSAGRSCTTLRGRC